MIKETAIQAAKPFQDYSVSKGVGPSHPLFVSLMPDVMDSTVVLGKLVSFIPNKNNVLYHL